MLINHSSMMRRLLVGVVSAALMTLLTVVAQAGPADAAGKLCSYTDANGDLQYVACGTIPGQGGNNGGGGGGGEPTCEFKEVYIDYCKGTVPCLYHNPAVLDEDVVGDDAGPKPGDDYHIAYWGCADGTGEWFWTNDDGPSREAMAWQAFGALNFPSFTLGFNPPTRTLVNLDTWWWADGASSDDLVGSAAAGIRAIAAPDTMEVDPGDGTGTLACDFSTTKSDECATVYRRSSDRQPGRVYTARMRLVWSVTFFDGAEPIVDIPGLPTTFTSDWQDVAVPVREVQTVVRPSTR